MQLKVECIAGSIHVHVLQCEVSGGDSLGLWCNAKSCINLSLCDYFIVVWQMKMNYERGV